MTNRLQVGITGGIGAGKSTICKIFNILGIPSFDADTRAKSLMEENENLKDELIEAFGVQVYRDEKLNREFVSGLVFNNQEKLNQLNAIVHPFVLKDYLQWVGKQSPMVTLKEAALLVETGSYKFLDKLIVVTCPLSLRINRINERDPSKNEDQIRKIISQQLPEEEKVKLADFVITNDGQTQVIPQVLKTIENIKAR